MADSRFFDRQGPFSLAQLAALTGAELSAPESAEILIEDVAPLNNAGNGQISFLDNTKYVSAFKTAKAQACVVDPKHQAYAPQGMALLLTTEPYLAYAKIAQAFYPAPASTGEIAPTAFIGKNAQIGKNVEIGHAAYIAEGATIGDDSIISNGASIGRNVSIGARSFIGPNATLTHCILGHDVILHAGVHIGQDGFGFARSPQGALKVPQLGRVIIEDMVEIGAGSCVDRGAGPDTVIKMGAKIDNLVQIGHNAQIGRFATLVAQVGIAGSAELGDGVVIAGQAGVAGHLKIGNGGVLAARSGLTKDMPAGETYAGFPAMPAKEWRRQMATIARLSRKTRSNENE